MESSSSSPEHGPCRAPWNGSQRPPPPPTAAGGAPPLQEAHIVAGLGALAAVIASLPPRGGGGGRFRSLASRSIGGAAEGCTRCCPSPAGACCMRAAPGCRAVLPGVQCSRAHHHWQGLGRVGRLQRRWLGPPRQHGGQHAELHSANCRGTPQADTPRHMPKDGWPLLLKGHVAPLPSLAAPCVGLMPLPPPPCSTPPPQGLAIYARPPPKPLDTCPTGLEPPCSTSGSCTPGPYKS